MLLQSDDAGLEQWFYTLTICLEQLSMQSKIQMFVQKQNQNTLTTLS
jgi:hypothetical protein